MQICMAVHDFIYEDRKLLEQSIKFDKADEAKANKGRGR